MTVTTKKEFIVLLDEVMRETKELMTRFPEVMMYGAILKQLEAVYQITVVENHHPTNIEYNQFSFAGIAVKNFEEGNPYREKLVQINYHFEHFLDLE